MQRLSRISRLSTLKWATDVDLANRADGHQALGIWGLFALAYTSLGVIYGDIGTSPLYVYSTIFKEQPGSPDDVLCAASLVFWSITLVVLVKYICVVLLADDNGQGGTFALYAVICRACGIPAINSPALPSDKQLANFSRLGPGTAAGDSGEQQLATTSTGSSCCPGHSRRSRAAAAAGDRDEEAGSGELEGTAPLAVGAAPEASVTGTPTAAAAAGGSALPEQRRLSCLGGWLQRQLGFKKYAQWVLLGATLLMTGMVLGDGVLTPAISVLSAVQGLQVKASLTQEAVIGITCAILVALFAFQSQGTARVGFAFAPIVLLWFLCNMGVAIWNIVTFEGGAVFRALSPHYIVLFFEKEGTEGWKRLAGVFLCLTGCEAMFADLGHFSRRAVQVSFCLLVYPALILTYLGQASWLMHNPEGYSAVFYNCIPGAMFWPMFIISVLTSVVASQALISGSFSIVQQSLAMGCFPRVKVHHTSSAVGGQIYIAEVNYSLMVLCIAVVAGFGSGTAIGNAYGIAVNMVMIFTVLLLAVVMLVSWGLSPLLAALWLLPYAFIEGAFLSANLLNIPHGGWFSIAMALGITSISVIWIWGSAQKKKAFKRQQTKLSDLITYKPVSTNPDGDDSSPIASRSWELCRVSSLTPLFRNPGMAIVYSESPFQIPAVFKRIVDSWGLHSIVVFVTIRRVTIPHVEAAERLLLAPLEFKGFYRVVARYGYLDRVDQGEVFAQSLLDKIAVVVPSHRLAAAAATFPAAALPHTSSKAIGCISRESKDLTSATSLPPVAELQDAAALTAPGGGGNSSGGTGGALISAIQDPVLGSGSSSTGIELQQVMVVAPGSFPASATMPAAAVSLDTSAGGVAAEAAGAAAPGVSKIAANAVYVLHRSMVRAKPGSSAVRRVLLEKVYQSMWYFTSHFWEGWSVPGARLVEMGLLMEM